MNTPTCAAVGDPQLVGDPVDALSGAVVDSTLDFRLIGPLELRWSRHYNSALADRSLSVGRGCAHEFDRTLSIDAEGLVYEEAARRVVRFPRLDRSGERCGLHGLTVVRESERCYRIAARNQPTMEFRFAPHARRARLTALHDATGRISFRHDEAGRLVAIDNTAGWRVRAHEDDAGRLRSLRLEGAGDAEPALLIAYDYDPEGRLVATRNHLGHGHAFAYDDSHRMVWRRGRNGFAFRFAYDADGRCIRALGDQRLYGVALDYCVPGRVTRVTRPDLGVWTYRFSARGDLERIEDPLGGTRRFVRDADGRLLMEHDPNDQASRFVYGADGQAVARLEPRGRWIELPEDDNGPDPDFHRVASSPAEYGFGRLLAAAHAPSRHDALRQHAPGDGTLLELDAPHMRALIEASTLAREASHDPAFEVKPLRAAWWPPPAGGRRFNILGKLIEQHDGAGRTRRWRYDESGNPVAYHDFDGGEWRYEYGLWHFMTAYANPIGAQVRSTFTEYGQVASCRDPVGNLTEYLYDQKDQLREIRRLGVVKESYERDAAGHLTLKRGADGQVLLRIDVDPAGLPRHKELASGDTHRFGHDLLGRQTEASTNRDRVELAYDDFDHCVSERRNGLGTDAEFEAPDALVRLVFANRFVTRFEHDEPSSTTTIVDPTGSAHRLRRHPGGVVEVRFASGSGEVAQVDDRGRFVFKSAHLAAGPPWHRRYHWSGEGELRRVEDSLGGEVIHEYDAAHRLSGRRVGGRSELYRMDAADNLLEQPGLDGVRLIHGNRIACANGQEFTYDARNHIAWRRTSAGPVRYVYDSRDQLIRAELPDGVWESEYDALGRRTRKRWRGRQTEFHWYGDQLVAEQGPGGELRLYVYVDQLAQVPVLFIDYASIDAAPESGRWHAVFSDQIGAPCMVEDAHGRVVWSARMAPFGGADVDPRSSIVFNLRHPGHYHDVELGLHYNRFRHYDPVLGRYLQSDPWGLRGGLNLYAYRTNPLLVADVRGLGEEHGPDGKKVPTDEEGRPISPLTKEPVEGAVKVCQKTEDGKVVARYYVDDKGRTVRAEGLLDPPASYKKSGVGHVLPEGFESGRDHRGHLIPERSAASQPAVNVPENVIAEHGTKSNLSEKKRWENNARDHAENNPGTWSVHEPHYDGDNPRPSSATHRLTDSSGKTVPDSKTTIPNPTS